VVIERNRNRNRESTNKYMKSSWRRQKNISEYYAEELFIILSQEIDFLNRMNFSDV